MSTRAPYEVLYTDDGPLLMVRGTDPAQVHADALKFAGGEDLVVLDDAAAIKVEHIRATPCMKNGHATDLGWCDGTFRCHYQPGPEGPGAFSGAFIHVRHKTREEWSSLDA